MTRERIIFLTSKNPFSKKDWSGIPFFMMASLKKYFEIEYIGAPAFSSLKKAGYYFGRLFYHATGSRYIFDYGRVMGWCYGQYYNRKLRKKTDAKFIFVPAGLTEISNLRTSLPIVAVGDCSTLQLLNYYPNLKNVSSVSVNEIEGVERAALKKCSKIIFSSDWASNFVTSHFKIPTLTIPFGSNTPSLQSEVKTIGAACHLLFVGVDWIRKGGETALRLHVELMRSGVESKLTIVGVDRESVGKLPANVTVISIDKDSPKGELEYAEILRAHHFLILPTLADCTPIVIAEAFLAGTLVLATRTGGVASMVEEGKTGFLFAQGDVMEYRNCIMKLMADPDRFSRMSANCLQASANRFNWDVWAADLKHQCAF